MAVGISGAEQLADLSRRLKAAGEKELQRELSKAVNAAVKNVRQVVKQSAMDRLPNRGGLAARAAKAASPRVRRNGNGVRVVAVGKKGMKDLVRLDGGEVRHPVFGNRSAFVGQAVVPGFWTRPMEETSEQARQEIQAAVEAILAKIGG